MKYSEKNEFIKERWGVPLLNFKGGPGVTLLNFEGVPGVPLFNFKGVPGPTFKLWEGSRVPGPRVLVPLLHNTGNKVREVAKMPWYMLQNLWEM